ncbi:glycine betaine ABC transporter substrate-binding protein [soil metagenome]
MDSQVRSALDLLPDYLGQHVLLSAAALALGVTLSLPLAVLAARHPRVRWPVLAVTSLIQTIPGLALLALFYPLLLALGSVTKLDIPALGFLPSVLALTLYSMLPILRNGVAGLTGVDASLLEAADGVGMTKSQKLWRVEAPLAAPIVMAGIRTAAVLTIGAATLSTPVGQTSLGNYIFSGLQTENWVFVLVGCAAAAALALIVDQLLGLIQVGAAKRDRRRIFGGLAVLLVGVGFAATPLIGVERPTYVIGAKNFSEQYILASLIGERLQRDGAVVQHKDGLGSAVAFRALTSGDVDVYVDYSGTLWTNVMNRQDTPSRQDMLTEITRWMYARYGVVVLGSLGFENAYALTMKSDTAKAMGITSIADLASHARDLRLAADLEFLSRPEWKAIKGAYGLSFKTEKSYNPTFMYRAIEGGEADVISAFSSDGRIAADNLIVLTDPKQAIPSYDAVVLITPKRGKDMRLRAALQPLVGAIPVDVMRRANLSVDRDQDKKSPADAARQLAQDIRLP